MPPNNGGPSPLRVHRFLAELSQCELARRAGIEQTTLSYIERGRDPHLSTALKLVAVLGTTVEELFADRGPNGKGA
jgi:DNA-binding XRE family transcriptional regulator